MADGTSLINLGELSKPVTVLIEKVSAAVGVVFEPTRIVRKANAEAKADIIKANAGVEIRDIEKRAIDRLIFQETRKQENIESITFQAATNLSPDAKVEMLDVDWVTHFFKHCDTVSDVEMQTLWARVLTGEATKSGTFSKRTVQFISTLDKSEAELFTKLCQFVWVVDEPFPYITDEESEIYLKHGINFYSLAHLKSIGLIVYEDVFIRTLSDISNNKSNSIIFKYFDKVHTVQKTENESMMIGKVLFTKLGKELLSISGALENTHFYEHILNEWKKNSIKHSI